jgi:U4/U6.U5 tri-snRNP component SNU23
MRVERAGVDQVKERLEMLKRKIIEKSRGPTTTAIEDYESRLAIVEAEEEYHKKKKKEDMHARKKEKEAAEMESIDPDIAEMMGFGGFNSSKNK